MQDPEGDTIKRWEAAETSRRLSGPVAVIRIDGRAFSSFTRGCDKPCDTRIEAAMIAMAAELVEAFHARVAYVQSDEVTLVLVAEPPAEMPFGGRVQKLTSVTASRAAAAFMFALPPSLAQRRPHFDARVFAVEGFAEAEAVLRWRQRDARRNAVLSLGQKALGKKAIMGMPTHQVASDLRAINLRPEDYGPHFAFGTFLERMPQQMALPEAERLQISEPWRPAPGHIVTRNVICASNVMQARRKRPGCPV